MLSKSRIISIIIISVLAMASAPSCESFFPRFEGKVVQKGKTKPRAGLVIVEFFQTWCGACQKSVKHLNELDKRKDIKIVSVSDEEKENIKEFIRNFGVKYEVRLVEKKLFKKMKIEYVPLAYIFRVADRKIIWRGHPREIDEKLLDKLE